ncbi:MAG: AtpZ/AtpI family protein [Candidatus Marinimicrobia bacterium]|nr:AtpZ/AtpI family protein [Candidatus Neomarinimicrobiota bacterium]MDP6853186.1 AtpZ/AtpI family protein [Candidatus Neomarinimicrobiota bacterium]MDP6936700.1 AtpZ/AtpI family protein [Candidatus Neomarinimicrobiota bacterium]
MPKKSQDWLAYSGLGIQMVVTMLLCLWLGSKAEEYFSLPSPWGQLAGLFFGVFASIYNLIRSVSK